jgi:glycosyltransferase involved in cell wall biosynthesis
LRVGIPLLQQQLNAGDGWVAGFYYVHNALNALTLVSPRDVPEILAFVPASFGGDLVLRENAERAPWLRMVRVPDELISGRSGIDARQAFLDQHPVDIMFPMVAVPSAMFRARNIGWIPDAQHRRLPHFFSVEERHLRDRIFTFLVSFCDRVVCTSEAVRSDLQEFFPDIQGKAAVIPFSATIPASACESGPQATLERLGITRKYVYLPNQFWAHKNHRVAFEAWRLLRDLGHNFLLVCTGSRSDYRWPSHYDTLMAFVAEHGLESQIRILGFLDRDEQVQLYRGAGAVLQPSLFEGRSTSIEEAKGLGKRLIVSDIPVHHEQCGEDACYFDKERAEDLARAVEALWPQLPDGFDPTAEAAGRRDAAKRGERFGKSLVSLFDETHALGPWRASASEAMLGMLTWIEADRAARLDVIRQLSDALAASEAKHAGRPSVIKRLNEAARRTIDAALSYLKGR